MLVRTFLCVIRSATPCLRSSGSGFSFRLEERAEKRKEVVVKLNLTTLLMLLLEMPKPDVNPILSLFTQFFSKIIAKEAEKTNLQVKSKVYHHSSQ